MDFINHAGAFVALALYILYNEGFKKFLSPEKSESTGSSGNNGGISFPRLWKLEMTESISQSFKETVIPVIAAQTHAIDRQTEVLEGIRDEFKTHPAWKYQRQ